MAPVATIVGGSGSRERRTFTSIIINPAGGEHDADGKTDIFVKGGSRAGREALVDGKLTHARRRRGEKPEALIVDGKPVKSAKKTQILPEGASVHLS